MMTESTKLKLVMKMWDIAKFIVDKDILHDGLFCIPAPLNDVLFDPNVSIDSKPSHDGIICRGIATCIRHIKYEGYRSITTKDEYGISLGDNLMEMMQRF